MMRRREHLAFLLVCLPALAAPWGCGPRQATRTAGPQPPTQQSGDFVIKVSSAPGNPGKPIFKVGNWSTGNPDDLVPRVKALGRDVTVVIVGDADCPFKHIMTALDACARANHTKVAFRPPLGGTGKRDKLPRSGGDRQ